MNPEAVEWLESLSESEHLKHFSIAMPCIAANTNGIAAFYSIKEDHECRQGRCLAGH